MKKAAERKTVRPGCAVLAVLFFFCAALCGTLFWAQSVYADSVGGTQEREALYEKLCAVCGDALEESLRDYYDRGDYAVNPVLPAFLVREKTNLIYEIQVEDTDKQMNLYRVPVRFSNHPFDQAEQKPIRFQYDETRSIDITASGKLEEASRHAVKIHYALPQTFSVHDGFYYAPTLMRLGQTLYRPLFAGAVVFAALTVLFAVWFLRGALREGRARQSRARLFCELQPDLLAVILFPAAASLLNELNAWRAETANRIDMSIKLDNILLGHLPRGTIVMPAAFAAAVFAALLVWSGAVLFSLRRAGVRGLFSYTRYERISFTAKTIPALLILQSVKAAILLTCRPTFPQTVMWLTLEKIVLLPVLYRLLREMRVVTERTEVYVQGDLSHRISDMRLYGDLRAHGADVDSIAQRIRMSADEYIRSGRFKAELLTNLSHDIKTPLTSIINYAALLQKPDLNEEDRSRYLDVLHRHSLRLGRLVEDLTQTSDAQKGKIEAHPVPLDLSKVAVQAALGFEERLQTKGITLRFSVPREPVSVTADMRLLWRVCDNLMNNICKYAAPDSEAVIRVCVCDGQAQAIFENTPAFDLELSGEALMERFVRADDSRHTEGSGLGLSIARSLMQVQKGELRIETQTDRFTAILTFPENGQTIYTQGGREDG